MRGVMRAGLVGLLLVAGQGQAEASTVGDVAKKVWGAIYRPVNCAVGLVTAIGDDVVQFGYCFLRNLNTNPDTEQPIFTGPEHAEGGHGE